MVIRIMCKNSLGRYKKLGSVTVNTHIFCWPKVQTTGLVKTPETNTEVLNRELVKNGGLTLRF